MALSFKLPQIGQNNQPNNINGVNNGVNPLCPPIAKSNVSLPVMPASLAKATGVMAQPKNRNNGKDDDSANSESEENGENSNNGDNHSSSSFSLFDLDGEFVAAEVQDDNVPDGKYQVTVHAVELTESKNTHNIMLKWTFKILNGEYKGRLIWKNSVITAKSLVMVKRELARCGWIDRHPNISDLYKDEARKELLDIILEIAIVTKNDNKNTYINKRLNLNLPGKTATSGVNLPLLPLSTQKTNPLIGNQPTQPIQQPPVVQQVPTVQPTTFTIHQVDGKTITAKEEQVNLSVDPKLPDVFDTEDMPF